MTANIVDALKAVIITGNWDFAGELADDSVFVDCLRCFNRPRRILFDDETPSVYMCLFCANCWYAHAKHQGAGRRTLAECTLCDVVGQHRSEELRAIQALEAAERRYLRAHGWIKNRDGYWDPPAAQGFKYKSDYTRGHAVNAQKQRTYNAAFGGMRSEVTSG